MTYRGVCAPVGGTTAGGNAFWIESGQSVSKVDGYWRTSILVDPANGRYPLRVADAPPAAPTRAIVLHRALGLSYVGQDAGDPL